MKFIIADIIFACIGILMIHFSAKRGFLQTLLSFTKNLLALAAAYLFGTSLVGVFASLIPAIDGTILPTVLSYVAVFLIASLVLTVATFFLGKLIEHFKLIKTLDKILGGLLGVVLAVMALFVIASIIKLVPAWNEFYRGTWLIRTVGDSALLEVFKFLNVGNLLKSTK